MPLSLRPPGTTDPERIYLFNCPFEAKDEAKKAGAKWDDHAGSWYISKGQNLELFNKWHPNERKYLVCSYEEEEEAFDAGAEWDDSCKQLCFDANDTETEARLARWLPSTDQTDIGKPKKKKKKKKKNRLTEHPDLFIPKSFSFKKPPRNSKKVPSTIMVVKPSSQKFEKKKRSLLNKSNSDPALSTKRLSSRRKNRDESKLFGKKKRSSTLTKTNSDSALSSKRLLLGRKSREESKLLEMLSSNDFPDTDSPPWTGGARESNYAALTAAGSIDSFGSMIHVLPASEPFGILKGSTSSHRTYDSAHIPQPKSEPILKCSEIPPDPILESKGSDIPSFFSQSKIDVTDTVKAEDEQRQADIIKAGEELMEVLANVDLPDLEHTSKPKSTTHRKKNRSILTKQKSEPLLNTKRLTTKRSGSRRKSKTKNSVWQAQSENPPGTNKRLTDSTPDSPKLTKLGAKYFENQSISPQTVPLPFCDNSNRCPSPKQRISIGKHVENHSSELKRISSMDNLTKSSVHTEKTSISKSTATTMQSTLASSFFQKAHGSTPEYTRISNEMTIEKLREEVRARQMDPKILTELKPALLNILVEGTTCVHESPEYGAYQNLLRKVEIEVLGQLLVIGEKRSKEEERREKILTEKHTKEQLGNHKSMYVNFDGTPRTHGDFDNDPLHEWHDLSSICSSLCSLDEKNMSQEEMDAIRRKAEIALGMTEVTPEKKCHMRMDMSRDEMVEIRRKAEKTLRTVERAPEKMWRRRMEERQKEDDERQKDWDPTFRFCSAIIAPKAIHLNPRIKFKFTVWCSEGYDVDKWHSYQGEPTKNFDSVWETKEEANSRAEYLFYWNNPWGLDPEEINQGNKVESKDVGDLKGLTVCSDGSPRWTVGVTPSYAFQHLANTSNQRHSFDDDKIEKKHWRAREVSITNIE